jgi:iron complex outermembrane recepter protein
LKKNLVVLLVFLFLQQTGYALKNPDEPAQADSSFLLQSIEVEAHQVNQPLRTIPGSISVVTSNGLNVLDGSNFANVLNTLPGVTMQSGTYATNRIVIRGMGSRTPYNTNRIRSYLNDIPLTSSDGISTPEEIDFNSLGRIEIVKGPASALYGSGLGGTINMYTPNNKPQGIAHAQYGTFNTLKASLSGNIQAKNAQFWGSANHFQTDGFRENNQFHRTSFLSTAQWKKPNHQWNATLLLLNSYGQIPSSIGKTLFETTPQAAAPNWKAIEGYKTSQKALGGITLTSRLSSEWNNRFTLFGRWNDNYEKRPFNNLDDYAQGVGFRNKISYHTHKTDWIIGTEWLRKHMDGSSTRTTRC